MAILLVVVGSGSGSGSAAAGCGLGFNSSDLHGGRRAAPAAVFGLCCADCVCFVDYTLRAEPSEILGALDALG